MRAVPKRPVRVPGSRGGRGGQRSVHGTRTDGATASLRLPARIDTRLDVGVLHEPRQAPSAWTATSRRPSDGRVRPQRAPDQHRRSADRGRSIEALERRSEGTIRRSAWPRPIARDDSGTSCGRAGIAMCSSATAGLGESARRRPQFHLRVDATARQWQRAIAGFETVSRCYSPDESTTDRSQPPESCSRCRPTSGADGGRSRRFGQTRWPLEISLPLWRYPRPRDVSLPCPAARRRRLSRS